MNDVWLRYEKTENTRYVSHLDFVRMYGRALRRAHLPVAFSEGFNPHPVIGFALPLPVGYTSECEIIEISFTEPVEPSLVVEKLNEVLVGGVRIIEGFEGKSRMKKLDYALYEIYPEKIPESIDGFLAMNEIIIEKKTKSGIKETDIKSDIRSIALFDDKIEMVLASGSRRNLKPEVVMAAMNRYIEGYNSGDCNYHRKKIFDSEMNEI